MAKNELDLSGIDQIHADESSSNEELDLSGIDSITDSSSPEISKGTSFLRSFEQGASAGTIDEMAAQAEYQSTLNALKKMGIRTEKLAEDLRPNRDKIQEQVRQEYTAAQEANPLTSLAGNIVGGVATSVPLAVLTGGGATAAQLGKGLTTVDPIFSAATGAGMSDADTVTGRVAGAGLGYGLSKLPGAVERIANPIAKETAKAGIRGGLGYGLGTVMEEPGQDSMLPETLGLAAAASPFAIPGLKKGASKIGQSIEGMLSKPSVEEAALKAAVPEQEGLVAGLKGFAEGSKPESLVESYKFAKEYNIPVVGQKAEDFTRSKITKTGEETGLLAGEKKVTARNILDKANLEAEEAVAKANKQAEELQLANQQKNAEDLAKFEADKASYVDSLAAEKEVAESVNKQLKGELTEKVDQEASSFAKKRDLILKSLGSRRKKLSYLVKKQGVKIDTLPIEQEISQLGTVSVDDAGKLSISSPNLVNAEELPTVANMVSNIQKYLGEIPLNKAEELRDFLQAYAYDSSLSDQSKTAFKKMYQRLNESVDVSLRSNGLEKVADSFQNINSTYKRVFELEDLGIKRPKPNDIRSTKIPTFIEELAKPYSKEFGAKKVAIKDKIQALLDSPVVSKKQKAELHNFLKQSEFLSQEGQILEESKFASNLPKFPKEKPGMVEVPKVDEESIRQSILARPEVKSAQEQLAAIKDLEQFTGKTTNVGTATPKGAEKAMSMAEQLASSPKAGAEYQLQQLNENLAKVFDPDIAKDLSTKWTKAIEERRLIKDVQRKGQVFGKSNIVEQGLGLAGKGLYAAASLGGIVDGAIRKQVGRTFGKDISKATPEELIKAADIVQNSTTILDQVSDKEAFFTKEKLNNLANMLRKAGESKDMVSKNAMLYMLKQDPSYREIMKDAENKE